ncbi:MAG: HAMP domain-containing histidine kinase, partial [Syntrophobacterales bacterium]|nr:HAMP domain-containing histidine kinase [Syntrophobacterales bacterium]
LHNRNKLCGACSMAEVFETGKPCESDVVSSFGKKWILGGYPVSHEGGKVASAIEIAHDITTIKQAEAEIKSHQEHITLINQILRHDLTNDLVVIQSAISLYKNSPEEELLEEISSHAKKSAELIKRMGALETFISTHRKLKVCDIRDVIDETIKSYAFVDFAIKGKARVMADESLSSVIDNIVRNAVIHGKADRITITTGKKREMCEVRIADNGSGIPDDIKERIFEEGFTHGDTSHTGLGLHIVKKAMESYGGYAYVEDNEPKGAVFVMRFRMVT